MSGVVVVGSVALDTIEGPAGRRENVLGGSATYASCSASFFSQASVVACVGGDFPPSARAVLEERKLDLAGLETVPGSTFRWTGRYTDGFRSRDTLHLDLGVFAGFRPALASRLPADSILFLANIDPDLQLDVLEKAGGNAFVATDTIDHWIRMKRDALARALVRTDLFFLNDEEARLITGEENLVKAGGKLLKMGPKFVVLKKGEHGALLFAPGEMAALPAYPLDEVVDPTGAGDSYAGAMLGWMARTGRRDAGTMREAMARAAVVSSFTVEAFGLERLRTLTPDDIAGRLENYGRLARF